MYYNTNTYPSSNPQKWDPEEVLQLGNPTCMTCVGEAPSMRRRCRNRVAASNYGQQLLYTLAKKEALEAAKSDMLGQAAEFMLCWRHNSNSHAYYGDQASTVARQWRSMLEAYATKQPRTSSLTSTPRTQAKANITKISITKVTTIKVESETEYPSARSPQYNSRQRQEEARAREDKSTGAQSRREANARREEERLKQEQKEEEEEERWRQAQKKAEEKARQWRKEQERKEQEAREEKIRERARAAREKREQEARENARKEAAEWRQAWDRYCRAWENTTALDGKIPWPVKSGLRADVSEANVRLFFDKAPPEDLVSSGELRFKLVNSENRRWHTDKLMQRFGDEVVSGAAKDMFALVSKVLVVLRQEAQKKRRE